MRRLSLKWFRIDLLKVVIIALTLFLSHSVAAESLRQDNDSTLSIINDSAKTICYVFISPVSESSWGEDWLSPDETIPPGTTYSFDLVSGDYDVPLEDCDENRLLEEYGIAISGQYELYFSPPFPTNADATPLYQEGDSKEKADALFREGRALFDAGELEAALQKLELALLLYQKAGYQRGEAFCLLVTGDIRQALADYNGALRDYERSQLILQTTGPQIVEWSTSMDIGFLHYDLGQYESALVSLLQALDVARELEDREIELDTLSALGLVYRDLGQGAEAMEIFLELLSSAAETGDPREMQRAWDDVGLLHYELGQYEPAIFALQQALNIPVNESDLEVRGWSLSHIGIVYADIGQFEQALEAFLQALDLSQEIDSQELELAVLNNIGTIYLDQGKYEHGLEFLEAALSAAREVNASHLERSVLINIGWASAELGQYNQALQYYEEALEIAVDTHSLQSEETALSNIAAVYADLGEYEQALNHYQRALSIAQNIDDVLGEGVIRFGIATVHDELGRNDQALALYIQGINAIESILGDVKVEQFQTTFMRDWIQYYEAVVTLLLEADSIRDAFQYIERSRARAFLDQIGNQQVDFRRDTAPELIEEEQELRQQIISLQHSLNIERAKSFDQQNPDLIDQLSRDLEAARSDHKGLLTQLRLASPEYASLVSVSTLNLEEVQSQVMDDHTTLIDYFVMEDQTLAWVIDIEGFELVSLEITRDDLRNQVEYLRNLIDSDRQEFDPQNTAKLYQGLIAPLIPHIRHPNLIVVPHGMLHYLPFAALWDVESERFLVQDYAITYAPSASVLQFILDKRNPDEGRLLVMGNPDGSLRHSETEVEDIASLYGSTFLIGGDATESQVHAHASQLDTLHLSAHGVYNIYNPLYTHIELAPDDANDGYLEVHEVFGMDLTESNLVVLSACETALGELSEGDELVGLTRAFLYAGTPAVVTTLWNIDDEASGVLMESFYRHLQEGLTNAEALRAAQLEVLEQEEWQSPYYWAAFNLTGDYLGSAEVQPTPENGRGMLCGSAAFPLGIAMLATVSHRRLRRRS